MDLFRLYFTLFYFVTTGLPPSYSQLAPWTLHTALSSQLAHHQHQQWLFLYPPCAVRGRYSTLHPLPSQSHGINRPPAKQNTRQGFCCRSSHGMDDINPENARIFWYKPKDQSIFQLESIINVLVSYFDFIWIHMLWVYGHYKYIKDRLFRQNLTSTDVRFWRIKTVPRWNG